MAYDAKFLHVPEICWLGGLVHFLQISKNTIFLSSEGRRSELELMLQRGVKFEIEALPVQSLPFLADVYIPSKIQGAIYF
ncbi:hypothetical protein QYF36_013673 [Acer negundo]|nr:hypothetical protein QYF36_013673 [Acer negundo]